MSQQRDILVVIDPTAAEQPALARGAELARRLGCDLELLICHYDSRYAGSRIFGTAEREALRRQALEHQLGYLNSLARDYATQGLTITTRAVWDTPLAEGIIRACLRSEPRLVLKDTHYHSAISRTLFTNTDWLLIRDCPAPLWLVRSGPLEKPVILASVDPLNEHDKPGSLDESILDESAMLANALEGTLHVYHGYDATPQIARVGAFAAAPVPVPVEDIEARVRAEHAKAFSELIEHRKLAPQNCHLLSGGPASMLPPLARKLNAQLVVMGALARGRMKQAVVGSTAERVLDHLPGDVLIVKPQGYQSAVTFKARSADFMDLIGSA